MSQLKDEDSALKSAAFQNSRTILALRQRIERELLETKEVLAQKVIELSQQREQFQVTLSCIGDAIITVDNQGRITFMNEVSQRILGIKSDDVLGHSIENIFHLVNEESRKPEFNPALQLLASKKTCVVLINQTALTLRNGTEISIEGNAASINDVNGRIFGAVIVFRDITRQRLVEKAQAHLAAIIESSQDAIIGKTIQGIITSWNKGAERMFGYRAEEIIGKPVMTIIPPDRHDEERLILSRLSQGTRIEHYETIRMNKSGQPVHVSLSSSPILDSTGKVVGASKIVRDISEKKKSETALHEETRNMELLHKTGTTLSLELDVKALAQAVIEAGMELSNAETGAFFYKKPGPDNKFALFSSMGGRHLDIERFLQSGFKPLVEFLENGTHAVLCNDAPQPSVPNPEQLNARSYLAVPVISRFGDPIAKILFIHSKPNAFTERTERVLGSIAAQAAVALDNARLYEIAQQASEDRKLLLDSERSARSAAERMSEMKDEFLATLSHELRTPLSAMLGWVQVLKRGVKNSADLRKGLDTIERNARVQTRLIEDLLDMSRITSGKVRLEIQPVSPHSFIEAAIETVQPAADAKNIGIEKVLAPITDSILGDQSRLQQIAWNLLSNAIKFTPKDGKVRISLTKVDSGIEFTISDTGIGIKPEFLTYIFERFHQADATTTRTYGGLGIGLTIAKNLVELHGGIISVRSPGLNQGTTFTVYLPLGQEHDYKVRKFHEHSKPLRIFSPAFKVLDLNGITALVVDDEADGCELIKRLLSECNATIFTARNAIEAISIIQNEKLDVLISDIGMPEIDGYEFLRQVRALESPDAKRLPAIALTAFARAEDRTRALEVGFQAHVSKPVDPTELIATVADVAGRSGNITIPPGRFQLPD